MPTSWDKTTHATLYSIGTQADDTEVIPLAGTSLSGTATTTPNPMMGAKLWNNVAFMHDIALMAGSFTVTLWGRVNGVTVPIAEHINGPTTAGQYPFDITTHTPYAPRPEAISFDETAAGGLTSVVYAIAKNYRGYYPGVTRDGEHTIEGRLLGSTVSTADTTFTLVNNPAVTAGGAAGAKLAGLDKFSLWDCFCAYANVTAASATHRLHIVSSFGGGTVTIASTPQFSGVTKVAFQMQTYGAFPRPTAIIHDVVTGGGPTATFTVDFIAKTNRGQRFKR